MIQWFNYELQECRWFCRFACICRVKNKVRLKMFFEAYVHNQDCGLGNRSILVEDGYYTSG